MIVPSMFIAIVVTSCLMVVISHCGPIQHVASSLWKGYQMVAVGYSV